MAVEIQRSKTHIGQMLGSCDAVFFRGDSEWSFARRTPETFDLWDMFDNGPPKSYEYEIVSEEVLYKRILSAPLTVEVEFYNRDLG